MGASGKRQPTNSPENEADNVLGALTVKRAKDFLLDCINLPDQMRMPEHRPHFERWLKRWQHIFTFRSEDEDGNSQMGLVPRAQLERFVPKARVALRRIWHENDTRQRDWYFYRLRDEYHRMIMQAENPYLIDFTDANAADRLRELEGKSQARGDNPDQRARFFETWGAGRDILEYVPRICPFEAAVYWLQLNHRVMLCCENPTCPAPYFLRAPDNKRQKYCSPICAGPARRAAKLRWWNESPNSPKNRKAGTGKKQGKKSSRN